jgi:hypothetical protein
MMIPTCFGQASPVWRVTLLQTRLQNWAFGCLVSFDPMFIDLRVAFAALVTRSFVLAANALVRHVMSRAWRGARLAQDITAAATMVAAAGQ